MSLFVNGVLLCRSVFFPCDDIARLIPLYAIIGICDYSRRTAEMGVYGCSEINVLIRRRFQFAPPYSLVFYKYVFSDSVLYQRNGDLNEIRYLVAICFSETKPLYVFLVDSRDLI